MATLFSPKKSIGHCCSTFLVFFVGDRMAKLHHTKNSLTGPQQKIITTDDDDDDDDDGHEGDGHDDAERQ
jgi:hypothetical protein